MAHVLLCHGRCAQLSLASHPESLLDLPSYVSQVGEVRQQPDDTSLHVLLDGAGLLAFPEAAGRVFATWWAALEERLEGDRAPLLCVVPASFFPALVQSWKALLGPIARRPVLFVSRDLCAVMRALPQLQDLGPGPWQCAIRRDHPRWPWLRLRGDQQEIMICEALRQPGELGALDPEGSLVEDARAVLAGAPLACTACPGLAITPEGSPQPLLSIPYGEGSGRQLLQRDGEAPCTLACQARLSSDLQDISPLALLQGQEGSRKHTLHWDMNRTGGQLSLFSGMVYRDSPLCVAPFVFPSLLA